LGDFFARMGVSMEKGKVKLRIALTRETQTSLDLPKIKMLIFLRSHDGKEDISLQ
jgi:hypothetical protein